MSVVRIRKAVALVALGTLAALIVTADLRYPDGSLQRSTLALLGLLVPLVVTLVAFAVEKPWSRWLVLGAALAVVPWAGAFLIGPTYGAPTWRAELALGAAVVLLVTVTGNGMRARYEGRLEGADWTAGRMILVSWTIAANVASVLTLYLFVVGYAASTPWIIVLPAGLLLGLLAGVVLLAYQKTVGLLLVAVCCVLFLPVGGFFVWREARYAGEAVLFAVAFAPGVITGWLSLAVFSRPLLRYLLPDR